MNSKERENGMSSDSELEMEKTLFSGEILSHTVGDSSALEVHDEITEHQHGDEIQELDEAKPVDFSGFGKKEFVEHIKELSQDHDFKKIDVQLREIKPLMDKIRDKEKTEALQRFKDNGGIEEDFEYRGDE